MIAGMLGAAYLIESTGNETMLLGVYVDESTALTSTVFVIHPFL